MTGPNDYPAARCRKNSGCSGDADDCASSGRAIAAVAGWFSLLQDDSTADKPHPTDDARQDLRRGAGHRRDARARRADEREGPGTGGTPTKTPLEPKHVRQAEADQHSNNQLPVAEVRDRHLGSFRMDQPAPRIGPASRERVIARPLDTSVTPGRGRFACRHGVERR